MAIRIPHRGVGLLCILVLSALVYIPGYQKPTSLFWDENFHIASAQRYLQGVFFMEPHPPLGKLLIAAGEFILGANSRTDQFISEEKATTLPDDFSFSGYRLFPVMLGALVPSLVYGILLAVTHHPWLAFFVALTPVLDNALIVHNRGAMLEGPQLFFFFSTLLVFFVRCCSEQPRGAWLMLLGVLSSCALLTKINSAALLFLPLYLVVFKRVSIWRMIVAYAAPFLATFLLVWQLHFFLGTKIEPRLENQGFFGASTSFKDALINGKSDQPQFLFDGIHDAFTFASKYQRGVASLNYCKTDENGSYPLLWPFGGRSIQYRWDDAGDAETRFLYLVPNPWGWLLGLSGVIGALALVVSHFLGLARPLRYSSNIGVVLLLYLSTWLAPLLMDRVFYLYHYFIPLVLSWILFGFVGAEVHSQGGWLRLSRTIRWVMMSASTSFLVIGFFYFKPFTYHEALTEKEVNARSWLSLWDIRCKSCHPITPFARPVESDAAQRRSDPNWKLHIGSISANYIEQSLGDPVQHGSSLSVMTRSRIQFPLNKQFSQISGIAALPSDHLDGEVEFKIIGDGIEKWRSDVLTIENATVPFKIDVASVSVLTLVVRSKAHGEAAAFAEWKSLSLQK